MNNYGVLAIDLAKTVFQVCKTDSFGNVIYNKAVNRKRLKEILILEKTKSIGQPIIEINNINKLTIK